MNDISHLPQHIQFKFIHIEPATAATQYYYGRKFEFDAARHSQATVICEQQCHILEEGMKGLQPGTNDFCDYVTYKRKCYRGECKQILGNQTQHTWQYEPTLLDRPPVSMGNSMNRVLDLVVRLGYKTVLFAGCDGTPTHAGGKKDWVSPDESHVQEANVGGRVVHVASGLAFEEWGILFEQWMAAFLTHHGKRFYSMTPAPFAETEVTETQLEIEDVNTTGIRVYVMADTGIFQLPAEMASFMPTSVDVTASGQLPIT